MTTMRWTRTSLPVLLVLGALASIPARAQTPTPPCTAAEYRQFDFWLGDWEVYAAADKLAGKNRITKEFGGCVLQEHYDTGNGYSGSSFNTYDAGRKRWHQTWVDNSGLLLQLDGGLVEGRMILQGETVDANGVTTQHRITWSQNPDGSVRQLWESSGPSKEWSVAFDGRYVKQAAAD